MALVDFHTHILPGIDDGSTSIEQSIAMLQRLAEQGVRQVVATPHFYAELQSPTEFLAQRKAAETALREAMKDLPDMPELFVGAEVAFFEGISDCEFLQDLAIAGTGCVMVEMPVKHWSDRQLLEIVSIVQKQKLTPIIAHIDRYITKFKNYQIPERLAELPVYVQASASFFEQKNSRRKALRLLKKGKIQLIGSDCHNLDTRKPNMGAAIKAIEDALPQMIAEINAAEEEILTASGSKELLI